LPERHITGRTLPQSAELTGNAFYLTNLLKLSVQAAISLMTNKIAKKPSEHLQDHDVTSVRRLFHLRNFKII
jgi:hypothetical protein